MIDNAGLCLTSDGWFKATGGIVTFTSTAPGTGSIVVGSAGYLEFYIY